MAVENDEFREAVAARPIDGRGSPVVARILPEKYETLRYRHEPDPRMERDSG